MRFTNHDDAIATLKKEIAFINEHSSLSGQLGNYVSGTLEPAISAYKMLEKWDQIRTPAYTNSSSGIQSQFFAENVDYELTFLSNALKEPNLPFNVQNAIGERTKELLVIKGQLPQDPSSKK